jgi:hypothetical protein
MEIAEHLAVLRQEGAALGDVAESAGPNADALGAVGALAARSWRTGTVLQFG